MKVDKPSVKLINNLVSAIGAWASQTQHILAPHHTILKILFKTLGTESEFDYVRMELAKKNIKIYIAEEDIIKARGWIPIDRALAHGGALVCRAADDLERSEAEEEELPLARSIPFRERLSLVSSKGKTAHSRNSQTTFTARSTRGTNSFDVTYKSVEVLQKGTPSLVPCNEDRHAEIQRWGSSKRSGTQSEFLNSARRKTPTITPKVQRTRSSTILFLNSPEMAELKLNSGTENAFDLNWHAGEQKQLLGGRFLDTRNQRVSNESQGTASPSLVFASDIFGSRSVVATRSLESTEPEVLKIKDGMGCCQIL